MSTMQKFFQDHDIIKNVHIASRVSDDIQKQMMDLAGSLLKALAREDKVETGIPDEEAGLVYLKTP